MLGHRRAVILVLAVVVVAAGAWWTHRSFRAQLDDGRAQTLTRLLATSHAPRMVEAPGVEAWLLDLLSRAGIEDDAELRPARVLPRSLEGLDDRLRTAPVTLEGAPRLVEASDPEAHAAESLRLVKRLRLRPRGGDEQELVLTRRRGLFDAGPELPPEATLSRAAAQLVAIADAWAREASPGEPPLIRLYAIMEDGSFLSLPVSASLSEETQQSQRRPRAPSLVSGGAFLDLDFGQPLDAQVHYSGIYTDVGGSGFVATVSVPVQYSSDKLVIAADLSVDVDLARLVEAAEPHVRLAQTEPVPEPEQHSAWWQPWRTLARSLPSDAPEALRREVQEQGLREGREDVWTPRSSVVHRRLEDGRGALFALQVRRDRWLVGWAMETSPPVPWGPMLVIPGLLLALLLWAERRWARSEVERDAARSVLDLLEVPLVVVDPNDDAVVQANAAAGALGLRPGQAFGERVAPDDDSRSRYRHEQAGGGRRRAYGVRMRGDDDSSRFALVRSVSLDEPLPGLGAAAHRLALVCMVEDEDELTPVLDEHRGAARQDERNRLAALLDHGADTLARVLATGLQRPGGEDELAFSRWLAEYLLRRLHVSQWVLGRWGGPPRRGADRILGPEHLGGMLDQYERIFALVRGDARLRARLHWNNGVLAAGPRDGEVAERGAVIEREIDWPEGYRLTVPADGVFGFLLGELLVNAIKHGAPGSTLELEAVVDRGRRELSLRLRNAVEQAGGERVDKAYGGRAIAQELARLCGWSLTQRRTGEGFAVELCCPLTQQRAADEID